MISSTIFSQVDHADRPHTFTVRRNAHIMFFFFETRRSNSCHHRTLRGAERVEEAITYAVLVHGRLNIKRNCGGLPSAQASSSIIVWEGTVIDNGGAITHVAFQTRHTTHYNTVNIFIAEKKRL